MKPKLELVTEKNFSKDCASEHDLNLEHLGRLRLATEVFPDGTIVLAYHRRQEDKTTEPSTNAEKFLNSIGMVLNSRPVIARAVTLNKVERFFGMRLSFKTRYVLRGLKKYLITCDRRMADAKLIAETLSEK